MKKQNIKNFIKKLEEIKREDVSIIDDLDKTIYHMTQHDDLRDEHGFKNRVYGLHRLKELFKELDG